MKTTSKPRFAHPWDHLAVAVGLVGISGTVRHLQERRLDAATAQAASLPNPLANLPHQFGGWKARGGDQVFDSKTLQIVGCSDYIVRDYVDERAGVALTLLVAFGPAERVVGHTPEICYPAVGYASEDDPAERRIKFAETEAVFRSWVFNKGGERIEVASGFQHDGRWSPDASQSRKKFRHKPAMIKVQLQRSLAPGEQVDRNDPIDEFLPHVLEELDRSFIARR